MVWSLSSRTHRPSTVGLRSCSSDPYVRSGEIGGPGIGPEVWPVEPLYFYLLVHLLPLLGLLPLLNLLNTLDILAFLHLLNILDLLALLNILDLLALLHLLNILYLLALLHLLNILYLLALLHLLNILYLLTLQHLLNILYPLNLLDLLYFLTLLDILDLLDVLVLHDFTLWLRQYTQTSRSQHEVTPPEKLNILSPYSLSLCKDISTQIIFFSLSSACIYRMDLFSLFSSITILFGYIP